MNLVNVSKEEILKNIYINKRQTLWKWNYLSRSGQSVSLNEKINASEIDKRIEIYHKACLHSEEEMSRSMYSQMDNLIIHHEHLEWIHNEKRQMAWVKKQLAKRIPPIAQPNTLSGFQSILYSIDTWESPMSDKILTIGRLKLTWAEHKLRDVFSTGLEEKMNKQKLKPPTTLQLHNKDTSHTRTTH